MKLKLVITLSIVVTRKKKKEREKIEKNLCYLNHHYEGKNDSKINSVAMQHFTRLVDNDEKYKCSYYG